MPTFSAPDGTELAYHELGQGAPVLCLPGGPMQASTYYGELGGMSEYRRLVMLDLAVRRLVPRAGQQARTGHP